MRLDLFIDTTFITFRVATLLVFVLVNISFFQLEHVQRQANSSSIIAEESDESHSKINTTQAFIARDLEI